MDRLRGGAERAPPRRAALAATHAPGTGPLTRWLPCRDSGPCSGLSRWGVLHVHVDPTGPKLIKHLVDALLPCSGLLRPSNPTEIVVALIARTLVVVIHQTVRRQEILDVCRHRVRWSWPHGPIKTHSGSKRNACTLPSNRADRYLRVVCNFACFSGWAIWRSTRTRIDCCARGPEGIVVARALVVRVGVRSRLPLDDRPTTFGAHQHWHDHCYRPGRLVGGPTNAT